MQHDLLTTLPYPVWARNFYRFGLLISYYMKLSVCLENWSSKIFYGPLKHLNTRCLQFCEYACVPLIDRFLTGAKNASLKKGTCKLSGLKQKTVLMGLQLCEISQQNDTIASFWSLMYILTQRFCLSWCLKKSWFPFKIITPWKKYTQAQP